jgi:hypothetical protein
MDEVTRRDALKVAAAGAAAAARAVHAAENERLDRERVIACGMTEAEADCWEAVAAAAGKFFALPKLHPMDDHEVAHAIHVVQHKLLGRPTYRKYLELAKKGQK